MGKVFCIGLVLLTFALVGGWAYFLIEYVQSCGSPALSPQELIAALDGSCLHE